jgi:hypothetical protein
MTIGKKLYYGFGAVLVILVALFLVNIIAGLKESSARKDASTALESVRTIESVRYQIMSNRLNLNNFLLSHRHHQTRRGPGNQRDPANGSDSGRKHRG